MEKLNRFLVTNGVVDTTFTNMIGLVLPWTWSDHNPIFLKNKLVDYGPTPFKLFHCWFMLEGFNDTVVDAWKNFMQGENSNKFITFKTN